MRTFRKAQRHGKQNRHHIPAAKKRYDGICLRLRGYRGQLSQKQEREIAYLLNDIESYGFEFYPNHYHWDNLDQLESILNSTKKEL